MKITIGIKQDDKVVYLATTKVCDIFDVNKFISAVKVWANVYFKLNNGVKDEIEKN